MNNQKKHTHTFANLAPVFDAYGYVDYCGRRYSVLALAALLKALRGPLDRITSTHKARICQRCKRVRVSGAMICSECSRALVKQQRKS